MLRPPSDCFRSLKTGYFPFTAGDWVVEDARVRTGQLDVLRGSSGLESFKIFKRSRFYLRIFAASWYLVSDVDPAEEPKREPVAIFYGSRKPWHTIKKERPLHLAAAHLAAAGANNRRIAQSLGKTEVWMSNLARQPFFQERVVSILKGRNRDALESAFRIQRFSNPASLVELRDGSKKPVVDTRMVRARDILDRTFRKKEVTSSPDP
jgi:hypothetical protein